MNILLVNKNVLPLRQLFMHAEGINRQEAQTIYSTGPLQFHYKTADYDNNPVTFGQFHTKSSQMAESSAALHAS